VSYPSNYIAATPTLIFLERDVVISIENESSELLIKGYSVIAMTSYPGSKREMLPVV